MDAIEPGLGNDVDLALLRAKELAEALEAVGRADEQVEGHIVCAMAETIYEKVRAAEELLEKERRTQKKEPTHG
jgi:hypothetical protein